MARLIWVEVDIAYIYLADSDMAHRNADGVAH